MVLMMVGAAVMEDTSHDMGNSVYSRHTQWAGMSSVQDGQDGHQRARVAVGSTIMSFGSELFDESMQFRRLFMKCLTDCVRGNPSFAQTLEQTCTPIEEDHDDGVLRRPCPSDGGQEWALINMAQKGHREQPQHLDSIRAHNMGVIANQEDMYMREDGTVRAYPIKKNLRVVRERF